MQSEGIQHPADVPGFALHLVKLEQAGGGTLATFQVQDRDPLQQMAVTVYASDDRDGVDGMIGRAREEAINLLRRSICLLHAERIVESMTHPADARGGSQQAWPHHPRAGQVVALHEAVGLSRERDRACGRGESRAMTGEGASMGAVATKVREN
jgi:hypothetical protein